MTENYSGSTKIREKSSMHKRHKILFCKIFRLRISEDKNSPLSKLQLQQNPEKPFQLANLLYGLLTSPVRLLIHHLYGLDLYGHMSHNCTDHTCTCLHTCVCCTDCTVTRVVLSMYNSHVWPQLSLCELTRAASLSWLKNQKKKTRNPRPDLSKVKNFLC
jgi:hypothetical protein